MCASYDRWGQVAFVICAVGAYPGHGWWGWRAGHLIVHETGTGGGFQRGALPIRARRGAPPPAAQDAAADGHDGDRGGQDGEQQEGVIAVVHGCEWWPLSWVGKQLR